MQYTYIKKQTVGRSIVRRYARVLLGAGLVLAAAGAYVVNSVGLFATDPVFTTRQGALDGFDPVEYFVSGKAVRGNEHVRTEWGGAKWSFTSEGNRQKFLADPKRYVPAYGGYCAYAMANNYTANGDPEAFTVVGDRLFLNFDMDTRSTWLAERDVLITASDQNWPDSGPGRHAQ